MIRWPRVPNQVSLNTTRYTVSVPGGVQTTRPNTFDERTDSFIQIGLYYRTLFHYYCGGTIAKKKIENSIDRFNADFIEDGLEEYFPSAWEHNDASHKCAKVIVPTIL